MNKFQKLINHPSEIELYMTVCVVYDDCICVFRFFQQFKKYIELIVYTITFGNITMPGTICFRSGQDLCDAVCGRTSVLWCETTQPNKLFSPSLCSEYYRECSQRPFLLAATVGR